MKYLQLRECEGCREMREVERGEEEERNGNIFVMNQAFEGGVFGIFLYGQMSLRKLDSLFLTSIDAIK